MDLAGVTDAGLAVPAEIDFGALQLRRTDGDEVVFDGQTLLRVWIASGYSADELREAPAVKVCRFIGRWYLQHVLSDGTTHEEEDYLFEQLMSASPPSRLVAA